jgi:hypothetical protein
VVSCGFAFHSPGHSFCGHVLGGRYRAATDLEHVERQKMMLKLTHTVREVYGRALVLDDLGGRKIYRFVEDVRAGAVSLSLGVVS